MKPLVVLWLPSTTVTVQGRDKVQGNQDKRIPFTPQLTLPTRTHVRHAHNIPQDPSRILHPEYQLLPSASVKAPASSCSDIHDTNEQSSRLTLNVANSLRSTVVLIIMILCFFYGFTVTTSFLYYYSCYFNLSGHVQHSQLFYLYFQYLSSLTTRKLPWAHLISDEYQEPLLYLSHFWLLFI